jgi:glyoxylase-like metal-dependent hydrolase (beta-lactamase superfamily II)
MDAALTDLGEGIVRVTLPLPWALDHVHCYAVADPGGWTLVDTGLGSKRTLAAWDEALAELGAPTVRRVLITHYHPDHLGAATRLVAATGATEVVQGRYDAELSEQVWGDDADNEGFTQYLIRHGMPEEMARRSTEDESRLAVSPAPTTRLVDEGDSVELGGEQFAVYVMPGHADGHIVLHGQRSGRMLGGDVLLAEITPNVGRWPDTGRDPLGSYLHSLGRLARLDPTLVLPGHGPLIDDARARCAEIAEHHVERLDAHLAVLETGARSAFDVAQKVWEGELGFHEQRFALVEAISHLERLEREGRAEQVADARWAPVR